MKFSVNKYNFFKTINIISFVILLFVTQIYSQTSISSSNNSKKNLIISQPTAVQLSNICPGCQKSFTTQSYCLIWEVSTERSEQSFQAYFQNPSDASTLNLDWEWTYQDDASGTWKEFNNKKNPTSGSGCYYNNVFTIKANKNIVRFKVCIKGMQIPITQLSKTYNLGFNVSVYCYS